MARQRIDVGQLRIGMFVAELDRPWLQTKFPFQGFPVTTEAELAQLRQICKTVFIDLEKGNGAADTRPGFAAPPAAQRPAAAARIEVEQELPVAKQVFGECKRILERNMSALVAGGELDAPSVQDSVRKISDSIERNPEAMLLLTKLRQKDERHFARALEVSVLMVTFGRFLQLPREQLELLGLVGLLQDIGKVKVPDPILGKRQPLSADELRLAKSHAVQSAAMLRETRDFPQGLADLVLLHHERFDGTGYPRGLAGEEIGMIGWIAAIADSYSAMTNWRPYAEQLSPSNALGVLYKGRGTLYHEALVEQFIQCIGIYPVGSVVELNSGEIGVVIAQNRVRRLQPRVMVLLDAQRNALNPQKILDLLKEPKTASGEPYRIRRTLEADTLPLDPRDFFL